MLGTFHLFTVRGVPIRIHFTVFILLFWVNQPHMSPLFVLLFSLLILLSVGLHELGHTIVAQRYGISVQDIVLSPIGGVARLKSLPEDPHHEIRIALAGPLVSFFLGLLGLAFMLVTATLAFPLASLFFTFALLNFVLLVFNLIPCFPMDGGRVFRAWYSLKKGPLEATRIAATVGKWISIFFIVAGLVTQQYSLAVIGGFMLYSGNSEYRYMQFKNIQNQEFGQTSSSSGADFVASPPPYEKKSSPRFKMPTGFIGDLLQTVVDLYQETTRTLFKP
ncbi:site-2 protease family protein [Kiritimatiellota bacterium B12222]|nr:site-2 protease family protein [Kiritimatiellota bacterium B12222]